MFVVFLCFVAIDKLLLFCFCNIVVSVRGEFPIVIQHVVISFLRRTLTQNKHGTFLLHRSFNVPFDLSSLSEVPTLLVVFFYAVVVELVKIDTTCSCFVFPFGYIV